MENFLFINLYTNLQVAFKNKFIPGVITKNMLKNLGEKN